MCPGPTSWVSFYFVKCAIVKCAIGVSVAASIAKYRQNYNTEKLVAWNNIRTFAAL